MRWAVVEQRGGNVRLTTTELPGGVVHVHVDASPVVVARVSGEGARGPEGPTGATVATWGIDGDLQVQVGSHQWVVPFDCRLGPVRVTLGAASPPVGAAAIFDVNLDGTTIFTTQANRPTVPDGATYSAAATPDVTTATAGQRLTVDVDQVGAVAPGSDPTVQLLLTPLG